MDFVVLSYRNLLIHPVDTDRLDEPSNVLQEFLENFDMQPFKEAGTNIRLHTTATGIGRHNIFRRIEVGPDLVRFKALSQSAEEAGAYVEAHPGSRPWFPQGALLLRWSDAPGEAQTFHEIWLDDSYLALEAYNGRFVTAENNGKIPELVIDRDVIGEWQRFHYTVPPEGLLPPPAPPVAEPEPRRNPVSIAEAVEKIDKGPIRKSGILVESATPPSFAKERPGPGGLRPNLPPLG